MPNNILKRTPLGYLSMEILVESEDTHIPTSEVLDLIDLLRETANNLESGYKNYTKNVGFTGSSVGLKVH